MKNPLLLLTALLSLAATAQAADPCANLDALETREQILAAVPAGDAWNIALSRQGLTSVNGQWTRYISGGSYTLGSGGHEHFKKALAGYCSERRYQADATRRQEARRPTAPDPRPAPAVPAAAERRVEEGRLSRTLDALRRNIPAFAGNDGSTDAGTGAQPTPGPGAMSETERASRCAQARVAVNNCDGANVEGAGGGSRFYCAEGRAAFKTYRCE